MTQGWRAFPFAMMQSFHDGDSLFVHVDLGFRTYHDIEVRLYGISAPEVTGREHDLGASALRIARALTSHAEPQCRLWTWKQSFNRYVGRILFDGERDLSRALLALGAGRAWDGVSARPDMTVEYDHDEEVALYDRILARDFKP